MRSREIDMPRLNIDANQLNAHSIADIGAVETVQELSLDRGMKDAHPHALFGRAGDDPHSAGDTRPAHPGCAGGT